ncbi:MAG: MBL fold metallo-hydrolase [Treponema sp.]|jgi:glyoxylase-like metal-dependent hydrolase (beta-lactamase superfamily II)|nr:MBL fold metallo-hydrolase [Treponema sp.]
MAKEKIIKLTVGPIATNCWIYPLNDGTAAIIDPGDEADLIISTLLKSQLKPKFILLTHGHFDHICALPYLAATFRDKVKVAIHSHDSEYLGPEAHNVHKESMKAAIGDTSLLDMSWSEMPPADILLEEGSTIGPFTVLSLPGHTPGSVAFWDKEAGVLFSGDTLFADGYGRTDLPGGDSTAMASSLRRLFAMDENIEVYPGHGSATTIGREK